MDTAVLELLLRYGMIAVFVAVALEYACFPVPSELVLPFAGALAASAGHSYPFTLLVSVAAGLTGCFICYCIGRFFGGALLGRLTRYAPRARLGLDASLAWFEKHGGASVLFGRVLPLFRTYISFAAGLCLQNPLQFAGFSAIGITVWNAVLVGLGFLLGDNWQTVTLYAKRYSAVLLPLVVALLCYAAFRIVRASRRLPEPRRHNGKP